MNPSSKRHLLPEFIKNPKIILWIFIIPQTILLWINFRNYQLIKTEFTENVAASVHGLFYMEVGLLLLAVMTWLICKFRKSNVTWPWSIGFLISHIIYLWCVMANMRELFSQSIEPWIFDPLMHCLSQWTFIMPGLFYSALRLSCIDSKWDGKKDLAYSIVLTVLPTAFFYCFFVIGAKFFRNFTYSLDEIVMFVFVILTILSFVGLIRLTVLIYNTIQKGGKVTQTVYLAIIALIAPIAGLILNIKIPFPVDFQTSGVYYLALFNGFVFLIPQSQQSKSKFFLLLHGITYPFSLYFFLVFLPFLPLSLPAIFAAGLGILILTPFVLFLVHTKKIYDDFQSVQKSSGVMIAGLIFVVSVSILPGYFTTQALRDKSSLNQALQYVYAPDYLADTQFKGSVSSVQKTLISLQRYKNGVRWPYLSGIYNNIVFEGMVLPDKKIEYMYKFFTGNEIPEPKRNDFSFNAGRRSRRGTTTSVVNRNRNVEITKIDVQNSLEKQTVLSHVTVDMHNVSESNAAELFREIRIPKGILITDFKLKVEDEMVPGQLFEKKAAMWVYHMIKDFTQRDPGLLTYKSPDVVHLNVYPFLKDQHRKLEITFQFPKGVSPKIHLGEEDVDLMEKNEGILNQHFILTDSKTKESFVMLSNRSSTELPYFVRQPYLHFIVDGSDKANLDMEKWNAAIQKVSKQRGIDFFKLSAANFEIQNVTQGLKRISEYQESNSIRLSSGGSLNLSRFFKHAVVKYDSMLQEQNSDLWKYYPVFVVLTDAPDNILPLKEMDFFKPVIPEFNHYWVADSQAKMMQHNVFADIQNQDVKKVVVFKNNHQIKIVPQAVESISIRYLGSLSNQDGFSIFNPKSNQFESTQAFSPLNVSSAYIKRLNLMVDNYGVLYNPSKIKNELSSLVERSRDLRVMIPATSFIVVEKSSQWEMLKRKEKQGLNKTPGLEFDEVFETPTPANWIVVLLFTVWLFFRHRKSSGLTQQKN